jgi:hypothetical protein
VLVTDLHAEPNPVRSRLTVSYVTSRADHMSVRVRDASGRQVAWLTDDRCSPGLHELHWDAASAPPGVYYLSLATRSATRVVRVIRVR